MFQHMDHQTQVAGIQLAAGLVVAFVLHNSKGIPGITVGGENILMWTCMTVMSAVGGLQHADFLSIVAAYGGFVAFTYGDGW